MRIVIIGYGEMGHAMEYLPGKRHDVVIWTGVRLPAGPGSHHHALGGQLARGETDHLSGVGNFIAQQFQHPSKCGDFKPRCQ